MSTTNSPAGPLAGLVVIEMAAIGPVPHCGLVLAEMGADVIRLDRVEPSGLGIAIPARFDALARGKRSVALDLKTPDGLAAAHALIARADALLEGFRPGVMERLGLGPEACLAANPKLVFGRISGWGDAGPLSAVSGHDLNYLGQTGALLAMGGPGAVPPVPLNLVADFGGGAMQLAAGVLAALLAVRASGRGQVVATSIYEGAAALTAMTHGMRAAGEWRDARADNVLDGGAPFYRPYATADGGYMAVAAIEPKFYRALLDGLDLGATVDPAAQLDRRRWPDTAARFAERFAGRTRAAWTAQFAGTDACVTPVLDWAEAQTHPQAAALGLFDAAHGVALPRTAPRFSATPCRAPNPAVAPGVDTRAVLQAAGLPSELVEAVCGRLTAPASPA
ncbi:MAG: CaiB/BaiF CoA-transferase family protein [Acetobacteraceae bacterium]